MPCIHGSLQIRGTMSRADAWLLVPGACTLSAKCPLQSSFANCYSLKDSMIDQFPCIHARTRHHQSFKYLPICWVIISFPFNLQGHLHIPPPALLRLLAADSHRHSAGGEMRSRPKSVFPFSGRGVY